MGKKKEKYIKIVKMDKTRKWARNSILDLSQVEHGERQD